MTGAVREAAYRRALQEQSSQARGGGWSGATSAEAGALKTAVVGATGAAGSNTAAVTVALIAAGAHGAADVQPGDQGRLQSFLVGAEPFSGSVGDERSIFIPGISAISVETSGLTDIAAVQSFSLRMDDSPLPSAITFSMRSRRVAAAGRRSMLECERTRGPIPVGGFPWGMSGEPNQRFRYPPS